MIKVKLINKAGHTYDMLVPDHILTSITGFGFKKSTEFLSVGDGFIALEDKYDHLAIEGTVFFNEENAYKKYFDFVQFANTGNLILEYSAYKTFRRAVRITEIEKNEMMSRKGTLQSEIKLMPLEPWYTTVSAFNDASIVGGKVYDYTYPYTYASQELGSIIIDSDSMAESPSKISIYGPCINPRWSHYVNGKLVATGAYTGEILANRKLVIDATAIPYTMTIQTTANEVISNVYQLGDFSTERFMFLESGRNRISVSHEGTNSIMIAVEAKLAYASV